MNKHWKREDEVLEKLGLTRGYVLQKAQGYRFTVDSILLAAFATVKEGDTILDMGTGGGILPFLLQKNNLEKDLKITGIDIQKDYVEMAERSRQMNGWDNLRFLEMDIRNIGSQWQNAFDLVVCNPPFFRKGEGRQSQVPEIALARHELAVEFPEIVEKAALVLRPRGRMAFVQRSQRLPEVLEAIARRGMGLTRLRWIHAREDAPAPMFMGELVKRPRPQLTVEAPWILYDANGNYREEVRQLYEDQEE